MLLNSTLPRIFNLVTTAPSTFVIMIVLLALSDSLNNPLKLIFNFSVAGLGYKITPLSLFLGRELTFGFPIYTPFEIVSGANIPAFVYSF